MTDGVNFIIYSQLFYVSTRSRRAMVSEELLNLSSLYVYMQSILSAGFLTFDLNELDCCDVFFIVQSKIFDTGQVKVMNHPNLAYCTTFITRAKCWCQVKKGTWLWFLK